MVLATVPVAVATLPAALALLTLRLRRLRLNPFLETGQLKRVKLRDGQLRFFGLTCIVIGLITLWLLS